MNQTTITRRALCTSCRAAVLLVCLTAGVAFTGCGKGNEKPVFPVRGKVYFQKKPAAKKAVAAREVPLER